MTSHKSNILSKIPSEPVALLGFIFRIGEIIPSFSKARLSVLLLVRNLSLDNTLLLIAALHCCEKHQA